MVRIPVDIAFAFYIAMSSASIRDFGARVRARTTSKDKSRASVLVGYVTAHTTPSNLTSSFSSTKRSNETKRLSLIVQHLNVHTKSHIAKHRTQAAAHSRALEIRIRPIFEIEMRHRFEDPRLARPDDPSSGSTRPAAWDKDMSVPVAAVGNCNLRAC